jgi:hypothetical protein
MTRIALSIRAIACHPGAIALAGSRPQRTGVAESPEEVEGVRGLHEQTGYPLLYVLSRVLGARDWWNGAPILSAAMLGKFSGLQVHHIFPKALLYQCCWSTFQADREWSAAGRRRLSELRDQGADPAHGGDAGRKRAAKISVENRKSANWNRDTDQRPDPSEFTATIWPKLWEIGLRQLSEETGLSIDYCSKIKRGLVVPHPRHWPAFSAIAHRVA